MNGWKLYKLISLYSVLILLIPFATALYSQSPSFFCVGEKADCISDAENNWYSGHLANLKESSIFKDDSVCYQVYRFTWLRSFSHPYCFTVHVNSDSIGILVCKMTDGTGGSDPGKLVKNDTVSLNKQRITDILADLSRIDFWNIPTEGGENGMDGAEWLLEGKIGKKYHLVKRWSPKNGGFFDVCVKLMKFAKINEKEIY